MSNWTHITSNLYIDTFKENINIEEFVDRVLSEAPQITGSEKNIDIFINKLSGYNTCVYNNSMNARKEYQTCVSLSIVGDLRDRDLEVTEKEFLAFIDFIKRNFHIQYGIAAIYEDYSVTRRIIEF